MTPRRLTRAQQVYALRSQGWTYAAIGAQLGISVQQARLDDKDYGAKYGPAWCVEWDVEGRYCFWPGRARDPDTARRHFGPYRWVPATVRAINDQELVALQHQLHLTLRDELREIQERRRARIEGRLQNACRHGSHERAIP